MQKKKCGPKRVGTMAVEFAKYHAYSDKQS